MTPTVTGRYLEVDGRPALRFVREYPHGVERMWTLVADPDELRHWFPARIAVEGRGWRLEVGAAVRYTFPPDVDAGRGTVLAVDPPSRFALAWEGEELRVDLEPAGDEARGGGGGFGPGRTRVTLTALLADPATAARTAAGWEVCLDGLGAHADGTRPPPAAGPSGPTLAWTRHYDAYVAAGVPSGAPVPGRG